jgi:hypothetical protein
MPKEMASSRRHPRVIHKRRESRLEKGEYRFRRRRLKRERWRSLTLRVLTLSNSKSHRAVQ